MDEETPLDIRENPTVCPLCHRLDAIELSLKEKPRGTKVFILSILSLIVHLVLRRDQEGRQWLEGIIDVIKTLL